MGRPSPRSAVRVASLSCPVPSATRPVSCAQAEMRPASTWPCLSPAGTVMGCSCHLDPGCPGSDETLRLGEERLGAHGPGQTPGHRCGPQRPGIAGALLLGPPPPRPPPPRDSCDQVTGQMSSPLSGNKTVAAGARGTRAAENSCPLISDWRPRLAAGEAGARARPSLGAPGPLSWARQAVGGGRWGPTRDSALGQAPASGREWGPCPPRALGAHVVAGFAGACPLGLRRPPARRPLSRHCCGRRNELSQAPGAPPGVCGQLSLSPSRTSGFVF